MIETLLQSGFSNAAFALVLSIIAILVGRGGKRAHLAHAIWVLVFIKLLTPPVVSLPVIEWPFAGWANQTARNQLLDDETADARRDSLFSASPFSDSTVWPELPEEKESGDFNTGNVVPESDLAKLGVGTRIQNTNAENSPPVETGSQWRQAIAGMYMTLRPWILASWILGAGIVFARSLHRAFRFDRLLRNHVEPASQELLDEAHQLGWQLGLKRMPKVVTTRANLAPMVWWTGGEVRVILPAGLLESMDRSEWRLVLAHELAHVRRGDYLVRWLEWLTCVTFWWNPIVWLAQRKLRESEEICCDALVVSTFVREPCNYATALLTALESLSASVCRPPAMASEMTGGGFLERRFEMILSSEFGKRGPFGLRAFVMASAILLLPFGFVVAQDYDAVAERLEKAVESGELDARQAAAMMKALRRTDRDNDKAEERRDRENEDRRRGAYWGRALNREGWSEATEQQAKKLLELRLKGLLDRDDEGEVENRDYQWDVTIERVKDAVREGDLSEEQAERKFLELRMKRGKEIEEEYRKDQSIIAAERKFKQNLERIEAAVEEGDLSEDEAEEKVLQLRNQWTEAAKERELKLAELEIKRIKDAVKEGKVSREDAAYKILELRRSWSNDEDAERREVEERREAEERYEAAQREKMILMEQLEKAVIAGDLSKQDAELRILELLKKLSRESVEIKAGRETDRLRKAYTERLKEINRAREREAYREREADLEREAYREREAADEQEEWDLVGEEDELEDEPDDELEDDEPEDALRFDEEYQKLSEERRPEIERRQQQVMELVQQLKVAVQQGRVSQEEAKQKILALRNGWTELGVEEPEVSEEEVAQRNAFVEEELPLDDLPAGQRLKIAQRRTAELKQSVDAAKLLQSMERIKAAVQKGEINSSEAARALVELGNEWTQNDDE